MHADPLPCTQTRAMSDEDAERAAAVRHALNKRAIKPFVERLLEASGEENAAWLAWYRALRTCVDGKKDDIADALCQAYYHLRDKLTEGKEKADKANAKAAKVGAKRKREATEPAVPATYETELTASSCDLGFKNLAYAVVRVYFDPAVADSSLLQGVNFSIERWERVDCLAIAGLEGVNVNATNMHRLTEILMCGVAKHGDSLFGTLPSDLALPKGRLDYFLLENQKGGGGFGARGGSNVKTYAAAHILQACCMLHYAIKRLPACPAIEFVSSAKKTQDAGVAELAQGAEEGDEPVRKPTKRAKKGAAAAIKPVDAEALMSETTTDGDVAWRAPFAVGTEGLKWKKGQNPDPKKRDAEAKRLAKKAAAEKAIAVCGDDF